ncbi:MAG: carbamate kinase [Planctomycetota bacterium]
MAQCSSKGYSSNQSLRQTKEHKVVVIALGGNALIREGQQGTIAEQFENVRKSLDGIIYCLKQGYGVVITHGNGPQVGNMLLMVEASRNQVPELSLGVCVADTEGAIGYMIQQSLTNRLRKEGINKCVVTVLTQVIVDKHDKAFSNPTKPIGPFFTKEEAERFQREKGWHILEDSHRGYRRVVASPNPLEIVEECAIKSLLEAGDIVIAAGGGGIPVIVRDDGDLEGVDVVIDKDLASGVLARGIKADCLMMLTGVEHVFLNFKQSNERALSRLTVKEAHKYLKEGHFLPGSMGPKIQAAINFLNWGGELVIITSIDKVKVAFEGRTGTKITKD